MCFNQHRASVGLNSDACVSTNTERFGEEDNLVVAGLASRVEQRMRGQVDLQVTAAVEAASQTRACIHTTWYRGVWRNVVERERDTHTQLGGGSEVDVHMCT